MSKSQHASARACGLAGRFLAVGLLAFCGAGCACPELNLYREGIHAVDEPLYEAHLLLMDDAVAAGIRSDTDRQTVRTAIKSARDLYEESRQPGNN